MDPPRRRRTLERPVIERHSGRRVDHQPRGRAGLAPAGGFHRAHPRSSGARRSTPPSRSGQAPDVVDRVVISAVHRRFGARYIAGCPGPEPARRGIMSVDVIEDAGVAEVAERIIQRRVEDIGQRRVDQRRWELGHRYGLPYSTVLKLPLVVDLQRPSADQTDDRAQVAEATDDPSLCRSRRSRAASPALFSRGSDFMLSLLVRCSSQKVEDRQHPGLALVDESAAGFGR